MKEFTKTILLSTVIAVSSTSVVFSKGCPSIETIKGALEGMPDVGGVKMELLSLKVVKAPGSDLCEYRSGVHSEHVAFSLTAKN